MTIDAAKLEELVRSGIDDADVRAEDVRGDGAYYALSVASGRFSGLPLVDQHRMVLNTLKGLPDDVLHALQLSTHARGG